MRILITGGAGFLGSHLAEWCLDAGDEVTALDNLSSGRLQNLARISDQKRFRFIHGDAADFQTVEPLVAQAEWVYHLAAAVGVRMVVERPIHTISTNFETTRVVLEACSQRKRPFLLASTSEVYGKSPKTCFTESDDLVIGTTHVGRWSYACAKALDEFLAFAYAKERDMEIRVVRYFNTIGPRQLSDYGMVVPRFLSQALRNEPLTVFGDGRQSRCFTHVRDAVEATRRLALQPEARGKVVNVGNPQPITILDLAHKVLVETRSRSTIRHVDPREIYDSDFEDMASRVPDITRLQELTGFVPSRSVGQAIQDSLATLSISPSVASSSP